MYTKDTICRDNGKFVCVCLCVCVCVFSFTVSFFASPYLLYQWNLLLEEKAKLADPQNWVEFMNLFFKVFTVAILSKAETFTQWAKLQNWVWRFQCIQFIPKHRVGRNGLWVFSHPRKSRFEQESFMSIIEVRGWWGAGAST